MQAKILSLLFIGLIYSHEYPRAIEGYFSQKGQDKFIHENIFNNKKNGFFVEIGAHDGISFSNTYFFEKYLNWTGICIEPNPDIFKQLIKNRHCICEQYAISTSSEKKPFLKCSGYMLEMYSGLKENYDSRHEDRINYEMTKFGGSSEIIFVDCITLNDIFNKYNISTIDLLCIDIEGGEEAILKTIDLDKTKIHLIIVENNFNEDSIKKYLLSSGYTFITRIGKDDIYQLKDFHE